MNHQRPASYDRFTPRMALQIAAPHTWPASVMPALIAVCVAAAQGARISFTMGCVLLAICVLMQASVNTFNDYFDFVKGSDSAEDNVEASDATLVYNNVNPQAAKRLAVGFLAAAFALGLYVISQAGLVPLGIALVGAAIVVLYSAGKTPISYLPIGELVSGVVMGGLIPLACFYVLAGTLDPRALLWALPTVLGVGLIMMTNNACDIEKDIPAGRRTLPCLLGRPRTRALYRALLFCWITLVAVSVAAFFRSGVLILPFTLLAAWPLLKALLANPLAPQSRIGAMAQICSLNIALGAFYAAAILASGSVTLSL